MKMSINKIYYCIKPFIPRSTLIMLRRKLIRLKRLSYSNVWPIDENAKKQPKGWSGWPNQKRFALVLTHDVESVQGLERCKKLMKLELKLGFRSSFNFVAEQYHVLPTLRHLITKNGFEVGLHGLKHDGKLYLSKQRFNRQAERINQYLLEWKAVGFRSPSMHHNLDWIHELNISYDSSTFDTDPFEPQPDGVATIFPFCVNGKTNHRGYVELPYTLPQDYTLFILMQEKNNNIWEKKLDWIVEHGGMALLNAHPDYMNFGENKLKQEEYPVAFYEKFLNYLKNKYKGQYWHVLPKTMAVFWNLNGKQK